MAITNRQLDVLDYIKRFIAKKGYSPTIREIALALNFKSPSSVQTHLKSLSLNGLIKMDKLKSRTIELLVQNEYVKDTSNIVNVPLLDNHYTEVAKEFIELPEFMLNDYDVKNIYAFKKDNNIYLINVGLTFKNRPSLTIVKGLFNIQEKPTDDIFGNIIAEFKKY